MPISFFFLFLSEARQGEEGTGRKKKFPPW